MEEDRFPRVLIHRKAQGVRIGFVRFTGIAGTRLELVTVRASDVGVEDRERSLLPVRPSSSLAVAGSRTSK